MCIRDRVSTEKSALAFVMERHGIEWEHKGMHEKHLSVLDYKKQERTAELEQLGAKIEEKQTEFNVLSCLLYTSCERCRKTNLEF